MTKTLRRLLLLPAAALALSMTQAASAHADVNLNFRTAWSGGQCLRPDLYWPLGQSVHEYSCSDGLAHHWHYADVRGAVTKILWAPNSGCLIPNWDREGSPVVVTGGGNVCATDESDWEMIGLGGDLYKIKNVHTGLVLDYDDSGAGRGLQLWQDLGDANQMFALTP